MKTPLFGEPVGPSNIFKNRPELTWEKIEIGTTDSVVCEICGKHWSSLDGLVIFRVLDRNCVELCCGALMDLLYREWSERFTIMFLTVFSQNPGNPKLSDFVIKLHSLLEAARKSAETTQANVEQLFGKNPP